MTDEQLEKLRFPIGKYAPGDDIGMDDVQQWVADIGNLPNQLIKVLEGTKGSDLDNTYRQGSWTARQVIHHMADSHINAYSRMKRTLTEDLPTILPYDEGEWAKLPDVSTVSVDVSVSMLQGIHQRLYTTINDLSISQLSRKYKHADFDKPESMAHLIGMYAWHGRHHIGHLKLAFGK